MKEVKYLGHIFGQGTLCQNPDKVAIVKNMSTPKNVKELRRGLGLMNYFKKFMKNYSKIARPLYGLLKKDVEFKWTEADKAFNQLKTLLINATTLVLPDFTK